MRGIVRECGAVGISSEDELLCILSLSSEYLPTEYAAKHTYYHVLRIVQDDAPKLILSPQSATILAGR